MSESTSTTTKQTAAPVRPARPRRTAMQYVGLTTRGMAMGTCDVIPGVSGGTMAFILGIYEELIGSIRAVGRPPFLRALLRLNFRGAARAVNLPFLLAVLAGVLLAVVSLARAMTWLLANEPVAVWSFFFGLVVASVIVVSRRIPTWSALLAGSLLASAIATYFLVGMVPKQTPDASWFVFLSGALAICAMILPGISGSFILLLLGKYTFIVGRVARLSDGTFSTEDGIVLGTFALGCGVGLITFAQLLGWLLKRYHDLTVAVLTGLMLGSLRKLWPWKETVETIGDRHGDLIPVVERNILPAFGAELAVALALAVAGFAAVVLIERLALRGIGDHV